MRMSRLGITKMEVLLSGQEGCLLNALRLGTIVPLRFGAGDEVRFASL